MTHVTPRGIATNRADSGQKPRANTAATHRAHTKRDPRDMPRPSILFCARVDRRKETGAKKGPLMASGAFDPFCLVGA
jgi:hypothetical protein